MLRRTTKLKIDSETKKRIHDFYVPCHMCDKSLETLYDRNGSMRSKGRIDHKKVKTMKDIHVLHEHMD